jgi:iron-sulfur cluster repair protein YtfE (RIC family)
MPHSIAHQTVEELGGPGSVLVRQRADHEELDRLLHALDEVSGTAEEELLTRIDRLVFSHAFAEETVLWPVLRRVLPDGEALTLQVEKEHQEVNELVAALERDGLSHPDRPARLARLVAVLRDDVRD